MCADFGEFFSCFMHLKYLYLKENGMDLFILTVSLGISCNFNDLDDKNWDEIFVIFTDHIVWNITKYTISRPGLFTSISMINILIHYTLHTLYLFTDLNLLTRFDSAPYLQMSWLVAGVPLTHQPTTNNLNLLNILL